MGLQHYTQDMSKLPLKTNINVLFKRKYSHPTLICRGTDGRTENIYSIFRDKLFAPWGARIGNIKSKLLKIHTGRPKAYWQSHVSAKMSHLSK